MFHRDQSSAYRRPFAPGPASRPADHVIFRSETIIIERNNWLPVRAAGTRRIQIQGANLARAHVHLAEGAVVRNRQTPNNSSKQSENLNGLARVRVPSPYRLHLYAPDQSLELS